MNKNIRYYLFATLLLATTLVSCSKSSESDTSSKVLINEVLTNNVSNYQDDYGVHSPWIELFNKSFASINIAGYKLAVSTAAGDTVTYTIPKGDVLTIINPRQHSLFWADGNASHGTFHTNFKLDSIGTTWIGLYDSGAKLIDSVVIENSKMGTDNSYARISDGESAWEIKDGSETSYVTPSSNNKAIDQNPKLTKFKTQDKNGGGMAITAMAVVFAGLLLLFLVFKSIGTIATRYSKIRAAKAQGLDKSEIDNKQNVAGAVYAAIAMALHEHNNYHDIEDTILTINKVKRIYSPWSSKIYGLRDTPKK